MHSARRARGFEAGLLLLSLAGMSAAHAMDVYRWVDDAGVVHFSQWKPELGGSSLQTVQVEERTTQGLGGDVYPVEELAEAIDALRNEMAESRERRAQAAQSPAPVVVPYVQPVQQPVWPWWGGDRPGRPGRPDRPDRPPPPDPEPEPDKALPFRPPGGPT